MTSQDAIRLLDLPTELAALPTATAHGIAEDVPPVRRRESVVHYAYFAALACTLASILLRRL